MSNNVAGSGKKPLPYHLSCVKQLTTCELLSYTLCTVKVWERWREIITTVSFTDVQYYYID